MEAHNWLVVRLRGAPTYGIGARVVVRSGDQTWTRWIHRNARFAGTQEAQAHFGLGTATTIDAVDIWVPGAETPQSLGAVEPNQFLTIIQE